MKVKELIELLQECNPEYDVGYEYLNITYISQQNGYVDIGGHGTYVDIMKDAKSLAWEQGYSVGESMGMAYMEIKYKDAIKNYLKNGGDNGNECEREHESDN